MEWIKNNQRRTALTEQLVMIVSMNNNETNIIRITWNGDKTNVFTLTCNTKHDQFAVWQCTPEYINNSIVINGI
jgi:hypothetical protein